MYCRQALWARARGRRVWIWTSQFQNADEGPCVVVVYSVKFVTTCHMNMSTKSWHLWKVFCSFDVQQNMIKKRKIYQIYTPHIPLCTIFTILLTLWNSEQKNGLLIKTFLFFHLILMKLGEVVDTHKYQSIIKIGQKTKKFY